MSASGYHQYPTYVSVGEMRARAKRVLKKLKKKNPALEPVIISGRTLARSWWGKAWNRNLEDYADYTNRIGRGKKYVRNNAVLDLRISKGKIAALVLGSRAAPYEVEIEIDMLEDRKWQAILRLCNHRIDTLEELATGKFPKELGILFTDRRYAMFPSPEEISFSCSCPDYANMCKHVAAVLYGVGARLDDSPLLFFELRDIDGRALIRKSMEQKIESMLKNVGKKSRREIDAEEITRIFGL